ncbi:unnamed protein product [Schistosoma margrebowiei]|uniref:Uncharacterized protein n=1 Tax=Schistosoma margrebowiei TaxID=48269 RepID=A0A183N8Z0_9TREM|nr:unnamed protein product [Schistosoma margrebowiei]
MESSRPKEKRKTKEHITPGNGDRHEKNEQELDGIRKEGGGQSGLENAGQKLTTSLQHYVKFAWITFMTHIEVGVQRWQRRLIITQSARIRIAELRYY